MIMRIVFHGENAASFSHDFQRLVGEAAQISVLPDVLTEPADAQIYAAADVIVGARFSRDLPRPRQLQLFHVPGAGYDAVDLEAIPDSAVVCNCFGHEHAIAEYVMAALLERHVPLADADRHLRRGIWTYTSGSPDRVHGELAEKTIGLLGFGHIGKAIAARAKAFEMKVHVANRSAGAGIVSGGSLVWLGRARRILELGRLLRGLGALERGHRRDGERRVVCGDATVGGHPERRTRTHDR